ncbi:MAG: 50S ribosome-binding GTPase [Myxococcales bacterium]|nr:MAG: 50S ribosome-binding GTPase [Myxococcales bacterium]
MLRWRIESVKDTSKTKAPAYSKEVLRFIVAGSVDDGKSTLIGRLLTDSQAVHDDQLAHIREASKRRGDERADLALLTDGLRAEREQGITIDVAYRYFSTPKRKFIIADAPGHAQYTRNMVTGASTADLAVILVDARHGVLDQTRRHTAVVSLLGVKHVVFAINKMDRCDYDESVFESIRQELSQFVAKLPVRDVTFLPISALDGDNVVHESKRMPWHRGRSLLHLLETVHIASDHNFIDARFIVQHVIRSQSLADYRGYSGVVASGVFRVGDELVVLPSMERSRIAKIELYGESIEEAHPSMPATIVLEDHLDVSRGDMLCRPANLPSIASDLATMLVWLGERPLQVGQEYLIKHTFRWVRAIVIAIDYELDLHTLHRKPKSSGLERNAIGRVRFRTKTPLFFDSYERNRMTGSFIIVDEQSNETSGAAVLRPINTSVEQLSKQRQYKGLGYS